MGLEAWKGGGVRNSLLAPGKGCEREMEKALYGEWAPRRDSPSASPRRGVERVLMGKGRKIPNDISQCPVGVGSVGTILSQTLRAF